MTEVHPAGIEDPAPVVGHGGRLHCRLWVPRSPAPCSHDEGTQLFCVRAGDQHTRRKTHHTDITGTMIMMDIYIVQCEKFSIFRQCSWPAINE